MCVRECVCVCVCVCVCEEGEGEGEGECVCVCVIVWVGVGVIAWVKKGVCGLDSLHWCRNVCVRGEERERERGKGECVCVTVGVYVIVWVGVVASAWVKKGLCEWDSLDCCPKVCVGRGVEGRGGGVCVCV